jgi:hypothetical protein
MPSSTSSKDCKGASASAASASTMPSSTSSKPTSRKRIRTSEVKDDAKDGGKVFV